METILREILTTQKEMLAELRELRALLSTSAIFAAPHMGPPADLDAPPEPEPEFTLEPEPIVPETQPAPGPLTPRDLQDLGQSFTQARPAKSRTGLVDVSDLRGSLLDEIKGKNRAKSRAYDEFSKFRRDE